MFVSKNWNGIMTVIVESMTNATTGIQIHKYNDIQNKNLRAKRSLKVRKKSPISKCKKISLTLQND